MKKSIIIALVVIVLVVGGFFLKHMSSATHTTQAASTSSNTQTKSSTESRAVILTKSNSTLGSYLTDGNGNALYTYAPDTANVSNCTGHCLTEWPAYQAKSSTTSLPAGVSTLTRTDNRQEQYTYHGMPLYYFVDDHNSQVTGDGKDNFHVAKSATSSTAPQRTPSTNTSTSTANSGSSSW
ncbi:MAG: hypothetical protein ACHQT5_01140 [Candidatus Saccharimonadales bacterium]|jgi:predicted lipoprotein with Yx(FWY)xxD motif